MEFEKIPVIEDNCEAMGEKYAEKHLVLKYWSVEF